MIHDMFPLARQSFEFFSVNDESLGLFGSAVVVVTDCMLGQTVESDKIGQSNTLTGDVQRPLNLLLRL